MNRIIVGCFFLSSIFVESNLLWAETLKPDGGSPKGPSEFTKQMHEKVLQKLPFDDLEDFALAKKGLLAKEDKLVIRAVSYTHLTLPTTPYV